MNIIIYFLQKQRGKAKSNNKQKYIVCNTQKQPWIFGGIE